ncbi:uncharacterized protein LY89DRAFT_679167 [Mollisia scopiformis]|uniref:Complex 1 LYR protein domain-containing protein n=1 Tax=Mollisia scopiformis TaxID=149040 RepID=A0A194XUJ4_MOLSC|nr:uncharacterized protein LY89DRAFT_679167 [Mollisia scopiformis]KUJ23883.1 hypothetical protein LY89DRAFT_679167 [Mollisia scopiformis]
MRLLHQTCRTYASQSKLPPRPRRLNQTISLDHVHLPHPPIALLLLTNQFLQRGRALALWRTIIRDCRRISDPNTRNETLGFAREEFRRNVEVRDIVC